MTVSTEPFNIPKSLFNDFERLLKSEQLKFAKKVSEQFGLEFSLVVATCLPDEQHAVLVDDVPTKRPRNKSAKSKITDFTEATSQDELKPYKMSDLKKILEENDLPISGSKTVLINRVWGINHPEDINETPKKKRGRPAKSKEINTVEIDPEEQVEEHELDMDNMDTIYIKDGVQVESSDGADTYKMLEKKYLFEDGGTEITMWNL